MRNFYSFSKLHSKCKAKPIYELGFIKISYSVAYALHANELKNFNINQDIDVNGMIRFLKE